MRGLLLDLLATGDRAAADEAVELFIAAHAPQWDAATDRGIGAEHQEVST